MFVYHQHQHFVPPLVTDALARQVIIPATGQFSTRWEAGYNVVLAGCMPPNCFQNVMTELNALESAQRAKELAKPTCTGCSFGLVTCGLYCCWLFPARTRSYRKYQQDVRSICSKYFTGLMSVCDGGSCIRIDMI